VPRAASALVIIMCLALFWRPFPCESDPAVSYPPGVNAHFAKLVDFIQVVESVRQLDTVWATVKEPPLDGRNDA